MKPGFQRAGRLAFTLIELLVVIAIILVIAGLLLPALGRAGGKGRQIACLSNLKQVGAGFHLFANDHGDRFPMQVSTKEGGSLEYNRLASKASGLFAFTFRNFQVLSNELSTPHLLVCRADRRPAASNFARLTDREVSYFAGLQASPAQPNSVLSGDGNLTDAAAAKSTSALAPGEINLGWTRALHDQRGNVLFADGHVELLRRFAMHKVAEPTLPGLTRGGAVPGTPTSSATRPTSSGDKQGGRSSVAQSTWSEPGVAGQPPAVREPTPKAEVEASSTNQPGAGFSYSASTTPETREEWDTDRFRFLAFLFKLALLAYLIAGVILVVAYFLRKKKEREAGLG